MKRVKIVATLGPACESAKMIRQLAKAGTDCFRINTAFGDLEYYEQLLKRVRRHSQAPVMLDIKGTDIRLVPSSSVEIKKGEKVRVDFLHGPLSFNKQFIDSVTVGDKIFLQDGTITTKVVKKHHNAVTLRFLDAITIDKPTGVNVPKPLDLHPLLSKKDRQVLSFAKEHDVAFVALSFTKSKDDVLAVRRALKDDSIAIIAKIESAQGVANVDEILKVADGIMVARGDLGIEMDKEKVPILQKSLIVRANQAGKIVITATEMLQSMVEDKRPTRAETSDVANAILDGTDAVMLSAETAVGRYPVLAVKEMVAIAKETEPFVQGKVRRSSEAISEVITDALNHFCSVMDLDHIVTITRSGFTARMIARFRNNEPIVAVTREEKVRRQLELVYGVTPLHFPKLPQHGQIVACARFCVKKNVLQKDETVVFSAGTVTKKRGTNTITVVRLVDLL
ncbi:pyruvate kinase [Candidatus Woesearchaeota archaeon]|nr:pyruvate kinase [Candidatus Woesearchaeota archaeon]